ncbi:MAG: grasp-with-spasm system ATP-grasp peptide maturase [Bacteroidota bacterium]
MVIIVSTNDEPSTDEVLKWLKYFNVPFLRINETDIVSIKEILLMDGKVDILFEFSETEIISSKDITAYWYRRGFININNLYETLRSVYSDAILQFINQERFKISEFFDYFFKTNYKSIGSMANADLNKISVLFEAAKLGLKIPNTLISQYKSSVYKFSKSAQHSLITKSISNSFVYRNENENISHGTDLISHQKLERKSEVMNVGLFQNNIEKLFEIRSFFLHGKYYSMAIFSQKAENTKTDFRNYNFEKPNRTAPYRLPQEIENKLTELMHLLSLNTGSIDMIYGTDNSYYFLEINPVGQFGMLSYPCNYYLEKRIAEYLT